MSPITTKALKWIDNLGPQATRANFVDDHEPVGATLLTQLWTRGLIDNPNIPMTGILALTSAGLKVLAESTLQGK